MEKRYLSTVERTHLTKLKESLLVSPIEYFFQRVANVQQFKEVVETMGMWQWHYIRATFSSLIDTFKALGTMFYSLARMQFSVAMQEGDNAAHLALSALTKLALSLSLFCLQLVRFATLALTFCFASMASLALTLTTMDVTMQNPSVTDSIASSFSQSYGRVRNYVSSFFQPSPTNKKIKESIAIEAEIKEFTDLILTVSEERDGINKELDKFDACCERYMARQLASKETQFFSEYKNVRKSYSPEVIALSEMRTQLVFLFNNYPGFNKKHAHEFGYVDSCRRAYAEHHAQVMQLANEFFKHTNQLVNKMDSKPFKIDSSEEANHNNMPSIR